MAPTQEPEDAPALLHGPERWLHRVAMAGVLGGVLVPCAVIPGLLDQYTFAKSIVWQLLVALTFPAYAVLAARRPEFRPRRHPLALALGAQVGVLALATALAADPARAWWGTLTRMTGLFTTLHVLAWWFMVAGMVRGRTAWSTLLTWHAGAAALMAAVALVQTRVPGFAMFDLQAEARVPGLAGNPIFLASYLVLAFFLAALLAHAASQRWQRRLGVAVMAAAVVAMVLSGSRGPLLGLVAGLTVAGLATAFQRGNQRRVAGVVAAAVLGGVLYGITALWLVPLPGLAGFWSAHPNLRHLFELGDPARVGYWTISWDAFLQRPWLGWGPENQGAAYVAAYRPVNPCTPFYEDQPHSVVLDVLVTSGVAGMVAWLALQVLLFRAAWRARRQDATQAGLLLGLLSAHLVQNLVAFDTPASRVSALVAWALLVALDRHRAVPLAPPRAFSRATAVLVVALTAASGAVAWVWSVRPAMGSWWAHKAAQQFNANELDKMLWAFRQAEYWSPPYSEDWVVPAAARLMRLAGQDRLKSWPQTQQLYALVTRGSVALESSAGAQARAGGLLARMTASVGEALGDAAILERAGQLMQRDLDANPRRQNAVLARAEWLLARGRKAEAAPLLDQAVALDPDNAAILWNAGRARWAQLKQREQGARELAHAVECPCAFPLVPEHWGMLAQAYAVLKDVEGLRRAAAAAAQFPRADARHALNVAWALERSGLVPERNQVLRTLVRQGPEYQRFQAVLDGRASSMEEAANPAAAP